MIYQTLAKLFLICSSGATNLSYQGLFAGSLPTGIETMDGAKAIQIRSLLLQAADAIDQAYAIVSTLDSDDRTSLAAPLDEISSALHFQLLQKLYLRYPGLAEEGGGWDGAMV
jgi:hypothetical protein